MVSNARVRVGPRCRYFSDFSLIKGSLGRLGIKYRVETQEQAFVELSSRLFGHANVKAARGKFVFRAVYESGNLARAVRLFIAALVIKTGKGHEGEWKISLCGDVQPRRLVCRKRR